MRTTRTSTARDSDRPFRSRFAEGEDLFPLRQSLRARDELIHRVITTVILSGFTVALVFFGRAVHHLIGRHGDGGTGWLEPVAWGLVGLAVVVSLRRIWRHAVAIRDLRQELRKYRQDVERLRDQG